MADSVYFTVYTDDQTLRALEEWAAAERRSRNNLVQMLLAQALESRQTAPRKVASDEAQTSIPPRPSRAVKGK